MIWPKKETPLKWICVKEEVDEEEEDVDEEEEEEVVEEGHDLC